MFLTAQGTSRLHQVVLRVVAREVYGIPIPDLTSSSILEPLEFPVRLIKPILVSHREINVLFPREVAPIAQIAIEENQHDRNHVANNHSHCASCICWRLICAERLRADDVSYSPRHVVKSIQDSPY